MVLPFIRIEVQEMSQLALEYHNYRELKPTDDSEIVALFLAK